MVMWIGTSISFEMGKVRDMWIKRKELKNIPAQQLCPNHHTTYNQETQGQVEGGKDEKGTPSTDH